MISYNNQIEKCDNKIYFNIFLFPNYIISIACELGHLLHVHTWIDNFEILLLPYVNGLLFVLKIVSMTRSMYQRIDML